jgi:hypothetical protein
MFLFSDLSFFFIFIFMNWGLCSMYFGHCFYVLGLCSMYLVTYSHIFGYCNLVFCSKSLAFGCWISFSTNSGLQNKCSRLLVDSQNVWRTNFFFVNNHNSQNIWKNHKTSSVFKIDNQSTRENRDDKNHTDFIRKLSPPNLRIMKMLLQTWTPPTSSSCLI